MVMMMKKLEMTDEQTSLVEVMGMRLIDLLFADVALQT